MIRITKPAKGPKVLTRKGKKQAAAFKRAFTRNRDMYCSGKRAFEFDKAIYAHQSVKKALIAAQHGKCCFCESKITHISYGDVEHFRPKAGHQQSADDDLTRPGYYWLAYSWENLFLCCQLCNQRFKKNVFPLANPAERALSHHNDLSLERPLFIDPAKDDPEQYMAFREEVPYAIDGNERGRATIDQLGLNRKELREVRLDHYRMLRTLHELLELAGEFPDDTATIERARALLAESVQAPAQYAGMARAAITRGFKENSRIAGSED